VLAHGRTAALVSTAASEAHVLACLAAAKPLLLLPRTFGEADMALRLQVTVFFFFCLLSSPSSFLFIFFFFYFHLLHLLLLLLLLLLFSFILK